MPLKNITAIQYNILEEMPVAVIILKPNTFDIFYANPSAKNLLNRIRHVFPFNFDVSHMEGMSIDIFHKNPQKQRDILSDSSNLPHYARVTISDQVLDLKISAIHDGNGKFLTSMLTLENVTDEVNAVNKLYRLAHYDSLTGLPNRTLFFDKFSEMLREGQEQCAVLYIDLDGFSIVNDTYGHHEGDELIRQFGVRLLEISSDSDGSILFSRFGGDEFVCFLSEAKLKKATDIAEQIVSLFRTPFYVNEHKIWVNASVGVAFMPAHGVEADTLLGHADLALCEAKRSGKGRVCFFSEDLAEKAWDAVKINKKLRTALINKDELHVSFQNVVDLCSSQVVGRETLIRWNNPVLGWVSPAVFVPIAEQSDTIELLDEFVLEKACYAALEWPEEISVSVNISAYHFGRGTLVPVVRSILERTSLASDRLEIELTETSELHSLEDVISDLHELRQLGISIALDDFGMGYSSLDQLKMFPFNKIKIDSSFVKDALHRPDCAAVIHGIAAIGRRLGARVVAEGVETEEQHNFVKAEGCTYGQGYFYGKPIP